MGEIAKQITSPGWWFSVVVVGTLINLLATYLKSKLDSFSIGTTTTITFRSKARVNKVRELLQRLPNDQTAQIYYMQKLADRRVQTYFELAAFAYVMFLTNFANSLSWLVSLYVCAVFFAVIATDNMSKVLFMEIILHNVELKERDAPKT